MAANPIQTQIGLSRFGTFTPGIGVKAEVPDPLLAEPGVCYRARPGEKL